MKRGHVVTGGVEVNVHRNLVTDTVEKTEFLTDPEILRCFGRTLAALEPREMIEKPVKRGCTLSHSPRFQNFLERVRASSWRLGSLFERSEEDGA